jgi:hypothetical protein
MTFNFKNNDEIVEFVNTINKFCNKCKTEHNEKEGCDNNWSYVAWLKLELEKLEGKLK